MERRRNKNILYDAPQEFPYRKQQESAQMFEVGGSIAYLTEVSTPQEKSVGSILVEHNSLNNKTEGNESEE